MVFRGKTEYKAELSTSPVGSMVKLENLFNGLHENIDFLEKKIEQYQNDLEASKTEYDKPFAYSKELEEKLARQCELNAQLDLENAKAVDADLSGPEAVSYTHLDVYKRQELTFKQSIAKSKECYVLLRVVRKIAKKKDKCEKQAIDNEFAIELDKDELKLFKGLFAEMFK